MKRRTIFKSLVGGSIGASALAPAALAQTPQGSNSPTADDVFKIDLTAADAVADPRHKFFSAGQYSTLVRLCDLLGPAYNGKPSAKQAEAPEFLDFLLAQSPMDRQVLYAQGLDQLDVEARLKHGKGFAELSESEAAQIMAPLQSKWTWKPPVDLLARFLREAKNDVLRATLNSKPYADAAAAGSRRATGVNTYWDVIE